MIWQTPPTTIVIENEPASPWTVWAPIIIAVAALAFTVASFWWIHARRGRLVAAGPDAYALGNPGSPASDLMLRLPLAIYNTGAKALVVGNLRCRFLESDVPDQPWRTTRKTLRTGPGDVEDYPTPFPVNGRHAVPKIIEFGDPSTAVKLDPRTYRVLIEVDDTLARGPGPTWRRLVEFDLHVNAKALEGHYVAHRNAPASPADGSSDPSSG
jgi:hypothetical protein